MLFSLDNGDVIDAAVGGNESRWINHSCDPNCETFEEDDRIFVHALRVLQPGEELFYDYKMIPAERRTKKLEKEFGCLCGTPKCRGTMLEPRKVRRKKGSRGKRPRVKLTEPTNGARTANAVAHFARAGSHNMLAPGTHKGGQAARDVDGSFS